MFYQSMYVLAITSVVAYVAFVVWYNFVGWKRKFPLNLQEYLAKNPTAKTKNGIACAFCGSKSLRNLGAHNATDSRRRVSCNSCSSPLYHAKQ